MEVDTDGNGQMRCAVCYNLKEYYGNFKDAPNFWHKGEGKWFEIKQKKPVIVIDPDHGYIGGSDRKVNVGAQAREYKYRVKGEKDKTAIAKDIDLLPQYVLDNPEQWIVGNNKDNTKGVKNKTESFLVYDVSIKIQEILKHKGFECYLTRTQRDVETLPSNKSALWSRVNLALEKKADYFISIHTDGANGFATGSHAIYTNEKDDSYSKEIATDTMKFYDVIQVQSNSPKKDISNNVAILRSKNTVKWKTLIELGFITTPKEAKTMFSNIDKIAEQLVKGLLYNIEKKF